MRSPLVLHSPVSLVVGGARVQGSLARSLSQLMVRQALAAPTVAEIDFANPDRDSTPVLRHGVEISIALSERETIFEGEIASIEHEYDGANGHILRIRAYDRLQRLRTRLRSRSLSGVSAATLAAELADEIGCSSAVARGAPDRSHFIQSGQSDFDTLVDVAAAAGLYPFLSERVLRLIGLDGEEVALPLSLGRTLYSLRARLTNERAIVRCEAHGWNPATSDRVRVSADAASQDAMELRSVGAAPHSIRQIANLAVGGEREALATAQAGMDRASAAQATLSATAQGDARLRPGRIVQIDGVAEEVAGRYVITEALHRFTGAMGYTTEFATDPPSRPMRNQSSVISLGEVVNTNDPDGLARCMVKLPGLGDIESGWMPVLVPGAGKGKGIVALPEVGDEVLVIMSDSDPSKGIVLGGLYGRQRLPRGLGRKTKRPFVMRTDAGQSLELASEGGRARLSNRAGSTIDLDQGLMRLAAATDLVIEAPGRAITIRAASVNFEKG